MDGHSIRLTCNGDRVSIESENVSMYEASLICGALQTMIAYDGYKKGTDVEDVRNYMLDLHLSAMDDFITQVKKGESDDQSGEKVES